MTSRSATIVAGILVLSGVLIVHQATRERRQPRLLPPVPIAIPFGPPSSGFLESRVADFVQSATHTSNGTATAAVLAVAPTHRDDVSAEPVKSSDRIRLERRASRLVYVDYGKIGAARMATFFDSIAGKMLTRPEGSMVNGLRISSVSRDHVLLDYGKAPPLKKPRIDLDVDPRPDAVLTPGEKAALKIRFEELWGNRARVSAEEGSFTRNIPPYISPDARIEGDPRQRYLESVGPYIEKLRTNDPDVDPGNQPLVPTVEEVDLMRQQTTSPMKGATLNRSKEGKPPL